MSAVPSLPPPESRAASVAQLRSDLVRRFPGVVPLSAPSTSTRGLRDPHAALRSAPFLWVEVAVGQGGLSWLAAWTLLRLADDPLCRPALWIDTHSTLTPGDLGDLEGRLVVVRPADPHEAHVAADIALRAGSFSLVALEMHRALHPTPLARLSRLAGARVSPHASPENDARTSVVVWGEPPPFVAPPSGIVRTPFADAVSALLGDARLVLPSAPETFTTDSGELDPERSIHARTPHTTDRLRPLDRAADRRASPPPPRTPRPDLVDPERDDESPFPFAFSGRPR